MPIKLNVGLAKKVGQPGYGSLSANCSLEFELDNSLAEGDEENFQRQVRNAYAACAKAVNDELARQGANTSTAGAPQANGQTNGATRTSGDGSSANGSSVRQASQKQLDYASQLAGQIKGMGTRRLGSLAAKMFGKPLSELSSLEASGLIDMLKQIKAERISTAEALAGAAA